MHSGRVQAASRSLLHHDDGHVASRNLYDTTSKRQIALEVSIGQAIAVQCSQESSQAGNSALDKPLQPLTQRDTTATLSSNP
jgi:hypothetical protein